MSKQKRTFKSYRNMYAALKRVGVRQPGTSTMYILHSFLSNNGLIRAACVYDRGICEKYSDYQFEDWRKQLTDLDMIRWEVIDNKSNVKYWPGPRLIKYLNVEKLTQEEIATKRELSETSASLMSENRKLKAELSKQEIQLKSQDRRIEKIEKQTRSIYESIDNLSSMLDVQVSKNPDKKASKQLIELKNELDKKRRNRMKLLEM